MPYDRKSTRLNSSHGSISYAVSLVRKNKRLNSSHGSISYAVFCLKTQQPTLAHSRLFCFVSETARPWRLAVVQTGFFFFFNDTATTEIYTLALHDALPI